MKLSPPIIFHCIVDGKPMEAAVLETLHHPVHEAFRVKFSDGYQDDFYVFGRGNYEGEKRKKSPYLDAIKDDLYCMSNIEIAKNTNVIRWKIDDKMTNVWVFSVIDLEGELVHKVYYNSDYRFEIKKEGDKLLARSIKVFNPEKINDLLAKEIGLVIDKNP